MLPYAGALLLLAVVVAVTLAVANGGTAPPAPPAIVIVTPPPAPGAGRALAPARDPVGAVPSDLQQSVDLTRFRRGGYFHVPQRWVAGFYSVYGVAERTFGVNWLLLASVHAQETAFSTSASTYHGLNFARCCGGPMQFNVTNGPLTTWARFASAYRYGRRPRAYPHPTAPHPSIYDDFDAIMAAAWLLRASGAGVSLDGTAWRAAYDYYGHDATGIVYADQVLARAISWSERGFCANCGLDPGMVGAVQAAYGVLASRA